MADTDWGGLLGTVVIGGVAIKMTQSIFGENKSQKKTKVSKKNSVNYPRFNNPLSFK